MTNHIRWLGSFAALSACLLPQSLLANETEELRQRLEELESIVIDMESKMGGNAIANSFDSINLDFGGYFHGVARQFDTDNGDAAGFARNLLYLRVEADLSDRWSVSFGNLFGQVDLEQPELADLEVNSDTDAIPNFLDNYNVSLATTPPTTSADPNATNNGFNSLLKPQVKDLDTFSLNFPVDVNIQYKHNDAMKFTFGRQRAPVGYFTLYPMSWRSVELPRYMLSTNGVNNLFNPFVQGLAVGGQFYPANGEHILSYSVFTGDTTATGSALRGTNNNEQSSIRLGYARPDQSFSIGINYIEGKREDRTFYGGNRFGAAGIDIAANVGPVRVVAEYYDSDEGNGPEPRPQRLYFPTFGENCAWSRDYSCTRRN